MQLFRNGHIRWGVGFALLLGLAAYISLPYSTKAQKAAFAEWLDRNVEESGEQSESTIRIQIKQLPSQNDTFSLLLKEASDLVLNFQHDFKLPIGNQEKRSDSIGLWLMELWSKDQQNTERMDLILPEKLKNGLKWVSSQTSWNSVVLPESSILRIVVSDTVERLLFVLQDQPIPFLSGISINAP